MFEFVLGIIFSVVLAVLHNKILNKVLVGKRAKYRIWPFIPQPFYNLKNRFFYNFLWPLKKAWKDKKGLYYKDKDLIYAATSRCPCGAGLAYHRGSGIHGSWDCSDILTGRAIKKDQPGAKEHTGGLPFAFYEVKSEDQPSARGATTRPVK